MKGFLWIIIYQFLLLAVSFTFCKQPNEKNINNSCIFCHKENTGLSKHFPFTCFFCHKGNAMSFDKKKSHEGLIEIPGNLSNADSTCGICHKDQSSHIQDSLMTKNSGMISINRKVFGEAISTGEYPNIKSLDPKNSPADSYYSQLCASCHLGMEKNKIGVLTGDQKGGGCLTCHLDYSNSQSHPSISKPFKDTVCFNCHSRSSRISLNYNGLIEMDETDKRKADLILYDGRKVKKSQEDIHKTKGMSCTSCHKALDVMGDGKKHLYQEDAVYIKCESCHKVIESNHHNKNHERLSCTACHDSLSLNCFGCHISYNPNLEGYNHLTQKTTQGRWIEESGEMLIKPSALGITKDGKIKSFIPAMKLNINKSGFTGKKEKLIVRNLYAPSFAHTVTKKGRDCISCHKNSYALGFGEGKLIFENNAWKFIPEFTKENGLPQDAWIEPFQDHYDAKSSSIRRNSRAFNKQEQILILEVGKCIGCHIGTESWFLDFKKSKNYFHRK
jgi:hypothetical protein